MLSKEEFVARILDGVTPAPRTAWKAASSAAFSADDVFGSPDVSAGSDFTPPPADTRFAQLLLEESGFGRGETLPRDEIVLGDQKTNRFLPNAVTYWQKTVERPFHVLLFEVDLKGRELLADAFFRQTDLLEDALHRVVQDALEGFERGGAGRTADRRQGGQIETLCVVSILDDRTADTERQLVCFGTKSRETQALEVFTLREEVRDWDRPLAEEHLDQVFERHFKKLASGAKWQDAFITVDERKKIKALMTACRQPNLFGLAEEELRKTLRDVLDEIAGSFGIHRKSANQNRRLDMVELPVNHGIGADPAEAQRPGFKNPLQGVRIYDRNERLLGFIVYVASTRAKVEPLRQALATHNHFHNVLVIYPDSKEPEFELWQGDTTLRGRLTAGTRRSVFDGEGGVVQLLSRFFVVSKSAIEKPKQLAEELAWRAQHLKALAVEELEKEIESGSDTGPLKRLFDTFNAALATLTVEKFADAYAQTITYGMLAARWLSSDASPLFTRKNLKDLLPETSAFLKDLFDKLVNSNFDKNLSWLLDDITSLLARTSVAQVFRDEKRDPSIHFYEDFLDAYDPQMRKDQGVYYTPDEVVSYIVRTAHSSLQNDFSLPLGLADTTTWAAFAKAKKLAVPEGVDPKAPFVQVLDPALGTGTFLLRVIEVIHETMQAEYARRGLSPEAAKKEWLAYVRRDLLPRINGFELMMAPYIVSHLRLGLALQQTGFTFGKQDRLRVFLTNSLSPAVPTQLDVVSPHIAEEAKMAASIKLGSAISVVLGNPPYSGHSANNSITEIVELVHEYRRDIPELSRPGQGKWLQDDYVKFFRFAEVMLARVPCGVLGFITNNRYLVNRTFRGMRAHILATFEKIDVVDLHGDAKRGDADENVFQIQQGVAIGVFVRRTGPLSAGVTSVRSAHLRGPARTPEGGGKLDMLAISNTPNWNWRSFRPAAPYWLFEPEDLDIGVEYRSFASLEAIFSPGGRPAPGIVTTHDEFAVSCTEAEAVEKVSWLLHTKSEEQARQRFRLCTQSQWSYERAKQELPRSGWQRKIVKLQYRPFDYRFTVWDANVAVHLRHRVMQHVLEHDNVALCTVRGCEIQRGFEHVFVSSIPIQHHTVSTKEVNYFLPLYLYPDGESQSLVDDSRVVNIGKDVLASLEDATGKKFTMARNGAGRFLPEDVFGYIYAILFSASYREKYRDFLRQDYPRVPTRPGAVLFDQLAELGRALVDAHLLKFKRGKFEAFESAGPAAALVGPSSAPVGSIGKTLAGSAQGSGEVRVNDEARFTGIAERAWNLHIGGNQVLRKWLMDRKGQPLSSQEVEHYCLMVRAADCTAGIVERIDKAIGDAGGWPAAFSDAAAPAADSSSKPGEDDDE